MAFPRPLRAVVTGAGSGLGRAFALEIARRRGRVVVSDVRSDAAEETAALVRDAGGEPAILPCDVSVAEQVHSLAEQTVQRLGGVDLVVNNAGVAVAGRIDKIPLDDLHWIFGVNLWGVVHGCRAFVPHFERQGRGWILNVASAAGLVSMPDMAPYNITKAGVVALSETLRSELEPLGIGVTVLCPTFFPTAIMENARGGDERARKIAAKLMARSKLEAEHVAAAALDATERGLLYAVPMRDGRMMWRIKRAHPERFYALVRRTWNRRRSDR